MKTKSDCNAQVINCLKQVSQRHGIAIVTSIHQPNNEIIMKFDKLYVLAKEGICVYEGRPENLKNYLTGAEIPCRKNQVPIEILIKICSRSDTQNNETSQRLAQLMSRNRQSLESRCCREGLLTHGIKQENMRFFFKHMWYLMMRSVVYSLRARLLTILFQFGLITGLGFILTQLFNENIGRPDGCIAMGANKTCNESNTTLRDERWLSQNQRLHFFALLAIQFLITVPTVLIFTNEVRIFFNEHKNGIKILLIKNKHDKLKFFC